METFFQNEFNPKVIKKSLWQVAKWRLTRIDPEWPQWVEIPAHSPLIERVFDENLRVSFINHATVLIQVAGLNFLTDPIWSERCSPLTWIGPKRVHAPGIALEDLPPIDFSLVSHDHYDHLDLATLNRLHKRFQSNIFTGLGISRYLSKKSKNLLSQDMQWWQTIAINPHVSLTFVPAQHWSSRGLLQYNTTLWGGFLLKTLHHTIYFSGDSGFGPHFQRISELFPKISLAILPIGAYLPRWFMTHAHMNPEEAVLAHLTLKANYSLGIHFNTFALADEKYNQALEDLHLALNKYDVTTDKFFTLPPGQSWHMQKISE